MRCAVRVLATITVIGACVAPAPANAQSIADLSTLAGPSADTGEQRALNEPRTTFVIPSRSFDITAHLPVMLPARPVAEAPAGRSIWWATVMAAAGPLADGISTAWGMKQSGPKARVLEGNVFFHKLFGADVKASEILAFKIGQAALMAATTHYGAKVEKEKAIGTAILSASVHAVVVVMNVKNGLKARRLNAAYSVTW